MERISQSSEGESLFPITHILYHFFRKNQEAKFVEFTQLKHCEFVQSAQLESI